jgi:hypothetical protein
MMSQLKKLAKPFHESLIERKPGQGGGDYVSHSTVTEKALSIVGPYSIENVREIRGFAPAVKTSNNTYPAVENTIVGLFVTIRCVVDGREVCVTEVGDVESPAMKASDGARAKDALSDAVKRCWMRLGLGLHLWSQEHYVLDRVLERNESIAAHARALARTTVEARRALAEPVEPEKPHQETAVDGEPPALTDAEVERSVEAQEAYEQLQQPESVAEQGKTHAPRKLTKAEARRLHAKLGAIGYPQDKHYPLAEFRFKRDFTSLTELSISESISLVDYAERQIKQRKAA